MRLPKRVVCICSVAMAMLAAGAAIGQRYPNKPIRISTAPAGGGNDYFVRLISPELSAGLGQPVVVDNRNSILAPEIVARAPADGYTLLYFGAPFWLAPLLRKDAQYDPVQDFAPVTLTVNQPNVLVANPAVAANSVRELIALAKARPGALNYATAPRGSTGHILCELFKSMAGVNIVEIPYKGGVQALAALPANEVQLLITPATSGVRPLIQAGRLKALAVASPQPSALFPGVPTVTASGLPGFESVAIFGIFAPARTPAAIIGRLHREIVGVLNIAEVKDKLFSSGAEVVASTPEQLAAAVKAEMALLGKVIRDLGIRDE